MPPAIISLSLKSSKYFIKLLSKPLFVPTSEMFNNIISLGLICFKTSLNSRIFKSKFVEYSSPSLISTLTTIRSFGNVLKIFFISLTEFIV